MGSSYNMAGYIMLYEKEAERIRSEPKREKELDPSRHLYVGSYREWGLANGYGVRGGGKYFAEMKRKGRFAKINRKNYFITD